MNGSPNKKPLSAELRILVASLLSMGVILLWVRFFAPKPPVPQPQANKPAQTASASPSAPSNPVAPASSAQSPSSSKSTSATIAPAPALVIRPKADTQEHTLVIENDLYRVEFSNRGAVVKSWQLKKYKDDAKPQRILDVVHPEAAQQTGGWPFGLSLEDQQLETAANTGLYQLSAAGNELRAPAEVEFSWSDGHLEVTKHFKFDHSYVVQTQTSVKLDGKPITAGLAWLGGFGDLTVTNPVPVESVTTFNSDNGKISTTPAKKLDDLDKVGRGVWQGGKDFVGIQDRFFTAAFLPPSGTIRGTLEARYWKLTRTVQVAGQPDAQEPVAEVAATAVEQPLALRVYVGPKDYDDLKKMNPPLHGLVNFGWLEFIADPLFHGMKWLHEYIPNWGWTIVVLTLVINMLFFPLRISSYKTTMKMQRVGPEIKAIQERYKKYKLNDPKKAEMNKEVMAVYSREGINPVGGCFQMFLQMPIWFGLNTALRSAIEMRHATWLWITDLSSKDPYYALPILMGLSMYLVSKMTPMTSTDPQQQMMMKIMPVSMAAIFMISPISSGLAVYILTSSLVGIFQQLYLNRTHPVVVPAKPARGAKS